MGLKNEIACYRVRVGDIRIIYIKEEKIQIISIEKRSDTTC